MENLTLEDMIVVLGSRASLDRKPGKNWVESTGELPGFVREVAREIEKSSGRGLDYAIPAAISQIKKWAAKGNAKAAKAVAEWEALKAKAKSKRVKATAVPAGDDHGAYVFLSSGEYNIDAVRTAFERRERERRQVARGDGTSESTPWRYVREAWTTYLIVSDDDSPRGTSLMKVPYSVDKTGTVTFGEEEKVKVQYVKVPEELAASFAAVDPRAELVRLTARSSESALARVLAVKSK